MQAVRRRDGLRASVLEQLELMMEIFDRPDTLALAEPSPNARRQDYHPEHRNESQQDHNRHSPTTYLRSPLKSLLISSLEMVDGGEMHSADLVDTSPLALDLYQRRGADSSAFFRSCS